ncbi:MAG TPA: VCBS repeat-containing protein, partial [Candidatus Acidoferrum sp.]|nr:VCBS repeat-containing protein [Candidatus Acidoferrum sp.]
MMRMVFRGISTAAIALCLVGAASTSDVQFTDITQQAKVDFKQENSATPNKYLIETMGGGVALLDYDNDGRLDMFLTNGALIDDPMPDGKMPDKSERRFWNRLYHQNADGSFTDVTERAGISGMAQGYYSMGVAVGDYDNDGFEDIYVTGFGGNILYHNNGNGTFTDVAKKASVGGGGWSASAGFVDYDNDGKLDLFVTRYLDWNFKTNRYCGEKRPGYRAYCHPDNYDGMTNILYHNNGDGTFTDVSEKAGVANPHGKGLGVAFADYDGDGSTDIFVANDSVQCFLYHNNGNGTFSEVGLLAGVGYNEDGKTFAGMGVDFSDYDNDGLPDVVITDLSNERYILFRNNGDGSFRDATNQSGMGGATLSFSGWSTHFFDFDDDGWKD